MISRATVLLPCIHTLCESCASRSVNDGNIVCPVDEESFASEEYRKLVWPTTTAELKACCWNEAQGCTFVGTLQEVLTHYEEECAFHAVACPRCNAPVLQQDLPSHYRAGCYGEAIASAAVETRSRESVMVSAEAIETGLEELKALIRDSDQHQFPALQSKINELLEQTRNIDSQIEEVATLCRDSEHRLTQALGELSTTSRGKFQAQEALLGALSKKNSETNEIAKQLKGHGTQLEGIARTLRDSERRISDQLAQAVRELSATFAQKLQSQ